MGRRRHETRPGGPARPCRGARDRPRRPCATRRRATLPHPGDGLGAGGSGRSAWLTVAGMRPRVRAAPTACSASRRGPSRPPRRVVRRPARGAVSQVPSAVTVSSRAGSTSWPSRSHARWRSAPRASAKPKPPSSSGPRPRCDGPWTTASAESADQASATCRKRAVPGGPHRPRRPDAQQREPASGWSHSARSCVGGRGRGEERHGVDGLDRHHGRDERPARASRPPVETAAPSAARRSASPAAPGAPATAGRRGGQRAHGTGSSAAMRASGMPTLRSRRARRVGRRPRAGRVARP